jgi:hypothetical protein
VGDQTDKLVLRPVGALGLAARLSLSRRSLSLSRQGLFKPLLVLLASGDVNDADCGANRISPLVAERNDVKVDPDRSPVLTDIEFLNFLLSFTAEHLLIYSEVLFPVFGAGQLLNGHHQQFLCGITHNFA